MVPLRTVRKELLGSPFPVPLKLATLPSGPQNLPNLLPCIQYFADNGEWFVLFHVELNPTACRPTWYSSRLVADGGTSACLPKLCAWPT